MISTHCTRSVHPKEYKLILSLQSHCLTQEPIQSRSKREAVSRLSSRARQNAARELSGTFSDGARCLHHSWSRVWHVPWTLGKDAGCETLLKFRSSIPSGEYSRECRNRLCHCRSNQYCSTRATVGASGSVPKRVSSRASTQQLTEVASARSIWEKLLSDRSRKAWGAQTSPVRYCFTLICQDDLLQRFARSSSGSWPV
jgi:hypothetical protein